MEKELKKLILEVSLIINITLLIIVNFHIFMLAYSEEVGITQISKGCGCEKQSLFFIKGNPERTLNAFCSDKNNIAQMPDLEFVCSDIKGYLKESFDIKIGKKEHTLLWIDKPFTYTFEIVDGSDYTFDMYVSITKEFGEEVYLKSLDDVIVGVEK